MAGAAAKSVVLAAAIAKIGTEEEALKLYRGASGRRKVLDRLTHGHGGSLTDQLVMTFHNLSGWRDETSHGLHSIVGENHAYASLGYLLRLAQFVDARWDDLTA